MAYNKVQFSTIKQWLLHIDGFVTLVHGPEAEISLIGTTSGGKG